MPSVMQAHFLLDGSAGPGRVERRRPPLVIAHDSDALPPSGSREPPATLATLLLACLHFFGEVFDGKKHAVCAGYGCTEDSALGGFVTREHRALEAAGMPNVAVRTLFVLPSLRLGLAWLRREGTHAWARRIATPTPEIVAGCAGVRAAPDPRVRPRLPHEQRGQGLLPHRPDPTGLPAGCRRGHRRCQRRGRRCKRRWLPRRAGGAHSGRCQHPGGSQPQVGESAWPAGRGGRRTTRGRVGAVAVATRI